jgi:octaprenyl-diphosphate synthase
MSGSPAAESAPTSDLAKALIEEALLPVADDLRELNERILSYVPTETASARAVLTHVLGGGGKRIRPALFFMCSRVLGYRGDHYYSIAAVTELVHTASLLHDDVVDDSTLRRNKPTSNSIYGDETSVLVGDLVYSTASEMMAATGDMEVVRTFARAIRLMSDGELLQLENVFNAAVTEATYLRILECKTAVLIEASCKSAGLLAGVTPAVLERLMRFGYGVGMAFQLIDDALDYTGAAAIVGKSTLSDLPEGKVTLPVILLKTLATEAEKASIARILGGQVDEGGAREIARLVDKYDTASLTVDRAHAFTLSAMDALKALPAGADRNVLENLANKLLFRFN